MGHCVALLLLATGLAVGTNVFILSLAGGTVPDGTDLNNAEPQQADDGKKSQ